MKVLITHRYFWPDTPPYGAMLRRIAADLAAAGHMVEVFASRPSYAAGIAAPAREEIDGFRVRRCFVLAENKHNPAARGLNLLLYCWALFWRILLARPDVVTAATFPPVLAGSTAALAARLIGARLIYHLQDVHPEVSHYAGDRLGHGLPYRLLRRIDTGTARRAAACIVLSDDMGDTVRARPGIGAPAIHVINNFAVDAFEPGTPPGALARTPGSVRAIFAGNLGRFQSLDLLSEGIAQCFEAHPALELLFLGNGTAEAGLKARWGEHRQVRFWPFIPFADAREVIRQADIGLVSLAPDIYRVSYPSKVLTYLGLGVPLLALVEPDSRLAGTIRDEGLGAVPAARTPAAVADATASLLAPGAIQAAKSAAQAYHDRETATEIILARWRGLVAEMGNG